MAVGHVDLTIHRGTDFLSDFDFSDTAGDALDLSASTIVAKLRTEPNSTSTAISFDTSGSILADGRIQLKLTDTQTLALTEGVYYWDIMKTLSSDTEKLMTGRMTVIDSVSV